MAQKDVGNKIPIYKLKTTDEVMKYYDEWGDKDKYNKDMVDWNYTGPKETVETFIKHEKNNDTLIFDAGCGTGLVAKELLKEGYSNFIGLDFSQEDRSGCRLRSAKEDPQLISEGGRGRKARRLRVAGQPCPGLGFKRIVNMSSKSPLKKRCG